MTDDGGPEREGLFKSNGRDKKKKESSEFFLCYNNALQILPTALHINTKQKLLRSNRPVGHCVYTHLFHLVDH